MFSFRQSLRELVGLTFDDPSWHRQLERTDNGSRERAIQLLKQNLTWAQREQYESHNFFEVTGGVTGQRYRIRRGSQLNVEQLNDAGRCIRVLCFIPKGGLAVGDIMLAQKIALELFEIEALKIANKVRGGAGRCRQARRA